MGGRHHRPAVEPPCRNGVVEERGAHLAGIGDLRPGRDRSGTERPGERFRRETHVPPNDDAFRSKERDEGVPDPLRRLLVEVVRVAPPDVVGAEDPGHSRLSPERRDRPQPLDDPGKHLKDVVNVVFGVPVAEGEPERAVGVLGREAA